MRDARNSYNFDKDIFWKEVTSQVEDGWALKMGEAWICSGAEYLVSATGKIVDWIFSSLIHNCISCKHPALILKDFPFLLTRCICQGH